MKLKCKSFGRGEPVIILHGLFGALDNWQTFAKELADNHSVYILDQRNHGRSPHTEEMNYLLMAEDLRHFMESRWIHKAHLIGHSMGGKVAMQFALEYPDMVDKLIVVDIGPGRYPPRHKDIFAGLNLLATTELKDRRMAEGLLEPLIPYRSVRQFLLKNLCRKKEGGYRLKLNLPAIERNYHALVGEVVSDHTYENPALFIRGSESLHILPKDEQEIKDLFPQAAMETIRGASHWVHSDKPDELMELVRNFLGSLRA